MLTIEEEAIPVITGILAALLLAFLVIMLVGSLLLAWRLRLRHRGLWEELGEPLLAFFPGIHLQRNVSAFLHGPEYGRLHDRVILCIVVGAKAARVLAIATGFVFLLLGLFFRL